MKIYEADAIDLIEREDNGEPSLIATYMRSDRPAAATGSSTSMLDLRPLGTASIHANKEEMQSEEV